MKLDATTKVSVERLRLDRRNPRLMGDAGQSSDESIVARLYRAADLDELLQSISANGYLDVEPLVVTCEDDGDGILVLEGNRRLAALRLLREPDLADRIASSEKLRIAVPPIDEAKRSTIDAVSVYAVADRAQARSFIGFKHINGPAKWDAYAKARFAADWYKAGRSEGVGLDEIARAIGDRHDTVKRMVSAIVPFAVRRDEFIDDVRTLGSVLHRLRVPRRVAEAARLVEAGATVEGYDRLAEAAQWVADYRRRGRPAARDDPERRRSGAGGGVSVRGGRPAPRSRRRRSPSCR